MSLYGTGRREGILATLAIVVIVIVAHVAAALSRFGFGAYGHGGPGLDHLLMGLVPAIGGVLFYRFLRSTCRSRYAAFLGGAAYAMSPWLNATAAMPREQLAAALAPLALEAACRCARPDHRRAWLPWTGLLLAVPFLAGVTTVGTLATTVAGLRIGGGAIENRRNDEPMTLLAVAALIASAAMAASLMLIDPCAGWLSTATLPSSVEVLAAHRAPSHGLDAAAFLRLPGPVLVLFAVLGLLRHQRHASNIGWLAVAVCGALPTVLCKLWPTFPELLALLPLGGTGIPAAAFWLTLVAVTVLGTAGLDDFLERPMRRPKALPILLGVTILAAPTLLLVTPEPVREWPLVATFLSLAVLLSVWRSIGMLKLKNVLAIVAAVALAVPAVQVLTVIERPLPGGLPAAPGVETAAAAPRTPFEHIGSRPLWHFGGLALALLWSVGAAGLRLSRDRRRRQSAPAVRPAITRKPAAKPK